MAIFGEFLGTAFPASRMQHISHLHSKFTLRPQHCVEVWQTSNFRRLKLGKEKIEDRKKKPQGKNVMACPIT